ncbi:MAG: Gfo/Idh/MocA family oxidoreductase [Burkholderiaceae bacterium]|nr:Gfo/Idh/MocA family oxidoreductase [Microbacteriaceae bacterium]
MPGTLRWGILGPGYIAAAQTADLVGNGFAVAAVGSRSQDSARSFADRFGIPAAYGSYAELVADPDIDIVYIATPHSFHYRHARLALEAGKHVLLEKSFTVTGDQAAALVELAESKGLVLLEAMWTRFLPHMVRIRELLAAGTIGEVRTLIADHNQKLSTDPLSRINNPELAGGALLDIGVYPVSFAFDIFGPPATVQAHASSTATGVDRQTTIIFSYDSGASAVLQTALDTVGPNTATILGTEGWIAIDAVWYAPTKFTVHSSSGAVIEAFEADVSPRGMQYQAAELERLIEEGETTGTILSPTESVAIMRTLDEIRAQIGLDYPADILSL